MYEMKEGTWDMFPRKLCKEMLEKYKIIYFFVQIALWLISLCVRIWLTQSFIEESTKACRITIKNRVLHNTPGALRHPSYLKIPLKFLITGKLKCPRGGNYVTPYLLQPVMFLCPCLPITYKSRTHGHFKNRETLTNCWESQLSAGNYCIERRPGVITNSAPSVIQPNLYTSLIGGCPIH